MNKTKKEENNKKFSIDWLIGGILTKIGDTFDRLTGRGYKPSSSLATSELIEKLKVILDSEIKTENGSGDFVPHNIKLKMQWDKFSADSEEAIEALENELKIAAIDHINDRRYHTYAPINIEIKPDYFTEGVKLLASFEKFDEEEREVAVNVTVPNLKIEGLTQPGEKIYVDEEEKETFVISYKINGKQKETQLDFVPGERKSIGRTKENDLYLDDINVSKIHGAFVLNSLNKLMLADTGSTNGTFINGKRISYGRAFPVNDGDILSFGNFEVLLKHLKNDREVEFIEKEEIPETIENVEKKISPNPENLQSAPSSDKNIEREQGFQNIEDDDLSQVFARKEINDKTVDDLDESSDRKKDEEPELTKQGIILDFSDE